jgi:hypothetical protein
VASGEPLARDSAWGRGGQGRTSIASERVRPFAVSAVDAGASGSSTFFHFFSSW